ncbi:MAG: hypothetical protein JSS45_10630 [Proteobacteria bacterium]|nr:hypothetical protein [Pseudomonadota bacterium]
MHHLALLRRCMRTRGSPTTAILLPGSLAMWLHPSIVTTVIEDVPTQVLIWSNNPSMADFTDTDPVHF